jgi:hypothetical protein
MMARIHEKNSSSMRIRVIAQQELRGTQRKENRANEKVTNKSHLILPNVLNPVIATNKVKDHNSTKEK